MNQLEQEEQAARNLLYSNFILEAQSDPKIKYYIVDGQHRSGNNFWNNLMVDNISISSHKLFGYSFHNSAMYLKNNNYNYLDNVFNIVTFREPWEALKSFLVLTNREDNATEEDMFSYLDVAECFYDLILLKEKNIIPIDLNFGSINTSEILSNILSINIDDVYNRFNDPKIEKSDSLRLNHVPSESIEKKILTDRAEKQIHSIDLIKRISEISNKYYLAKLYARTYWKERGL